MNLRLMTFCALALAFASPAFAQDGATGEIEASTELSDTEKTSFAADAISEMRDAESDVSRLLATAEKEGDVLTINCLTKKLAAIRSLVEVSESASATMNDAMVSGTGGADAEFRKIAVALSKSRQFRAEAEACTGGGDGESGETTVDVEGDAWGLGDDTSGIEDGNSDLGTDPPGTTPFE